VKNESLRLITKPRIARSASLLVGGTAGLRRKRHSRLDLEQVGAGVGRARADALCCTVLQMFVQAALQPLKMPGWLALHALAKQRVATALQALADHTGLLRTAGDAGGVAQQYRLLTQVYLQALHRFGQRLPNVAVRHRDRADAELQPHDLFQQSPDLALREVRLIRQHAHQRQGAWPHTGHWANVQQRGMLLMSAANANTAQAPKLRHLRCELRQIEDLSQKTHAVAGSLRRGQNGGIGTDQAASLPQRQQAMILSPPNQLRLRRSQGREMQFGALGTRPSR
jgi:hypothetical protein